jgi:hypothetical protein
VNARPWPTLIISLLLASSLTGCASFGNLFGERVKPVEIQTKAVERTRLDIPLPNPVTAKNIEWIIITPENADQVWAKLKESKTDVVIIGLTDNGYEQLSVTIAELRNMIAAQRQIIIKYKEYYEPEKKEESKTEEKK